MALLVLGVALWWVTHLFPILAPAARGRAVSAMGLDPYKGLFALVSLGAVALMVVGFRQAEVVNLWFPPAWTVHLNNLLMLLAVALLVARDMPSGLRRRIRHPMLTSVKTWAVAHLLVNGDLAAIVLFGGLLGWAVVAVIGSNRRDGEWVRPAPGTTAGAVKHAIVTIVVFAVIVVIHWKLLGVRPFPG
jgi:uncharacterized membrane protein